MTVAELDDAMRRISELERMLYLDGVLIVKIWFHLSYKTHALRQKRREATQEHLRAVTREGTGGKHYESFLAAAERTIRLTDSGENPWHLVDAEDRRFRDYSTAQVLIQEMEQRLDEHRVSERRALVHDTVVTTETNPVTVLDRLDLNAQIDDATYKKNLKQHQTRLNELAWQAYDQKRSVILVFEGWDAAGKGGVIRRITTAIDARLYRVISVAAPSDEELAHHYLWRFWRKVPRDGYITIYDRSWYGRVLVERVEGLAKPYQWMRAYQEINDFEERLTEHGTILHKFWLHISPEEQLRRFTEREQTPWKRHKITEDDWRNREKWDDYKQAVNSMVEHTSTANAPWSLIPANDKKYLRVEIVKTICNRLEQALGTKGKGA
jgi:polyphosphate:AMP phosphotransferase